MKVLLSIKPEFANKIFDGIKKYEFRKNIFKREDIKRVIVYASFPVQQVIGEFEIKEILCESTKQLWKITQEYSGITKKHYDLYFANKEVAYAIKIGCVKKYAHPKTLTDFNVYFAPQSFIYL